MMASVLDRAGEQLGDFLPRLGGALVLLIAGLILAALLGRLVRATLDRLGLDRLADKLGAGDTLNQGILYIPRLLGALFLVIVGLVLGAIARVWVEKTATQMDFPIALGPV